ncbi:MAG: non-hydrolyzing UDP-N-acetylglucosamine 2-epimerase [Janthinobacterium lividum]
MKKIVFVFGTRPEAIKMAPLINVAKKCTSFETIVLVTAQHRQMLDQVLDLFKIQPDFDLDIMHENQTLSSLTSRVLERVTDTLSQIKPHYVIVHGDTTTTFAASLAAFYLKIPVAHIEAGLRTHNIYSPWPEEMNRVFAGKLSDLHFAPTEISKMNLEAERISQDKIHVVGNTVIDALLEVKHQIDNDNFLNKSLDQKFSFLNKDKKLILVTGHRRENFGEGFESLCKALNELALRKDIEILYPVHLNPNVQEPVQRILKNSQNIFLIEPQDYLPFVYLMNRSYIILTDSGGIQEEAPSLGKPVVVFRDTTERPEAVESGTVILSGSNQKSIVDITNRILDDINHYKSMSQISNPYGDGLASQRIIRILQQA